MAWCGFVGVCCLFVGGCSNPNAEEAVNSQATVETGTRFRVGSNSMAPRVVGPTVLSKCTFCNEACQTYAEGWTLGMVVRCPECGAVCERDERPLDSNLGAVVQITSSLRTPQRLSIVAFQAPDASSKTPGDKVFLKRVWGLPGETLTIKGGELWIDGEMLQKSFEELKRVAILVDRLPGRLHTQAWLNPRWSIRSSEDEDSLENNHQLPSERPWNLRTGQTLRWLHHIPRRMSQSELSELRRVPKAALVPAPLLNILHGNQGIPHAYRPTNDLGLSITLEDDLGQSEVSVSLCGITFLLSNRKQKPTDLGSKTLMGEKMFSLAICDNRILMHSDRQAEVAIDLENLAYNTYPAQAGVPGGLAWGARSPARVDFAVLAGDICLADVEIFRDLHLLVSQEVGSEDSWQLAVGPGELAVFGDNLLISEDSRTVLGCVPLAEVTGVLRRENP